MVPEKNIKKPMPNSTSMDFYAFALMLKSSFTFCKLWFSASRQKHKNLI
jgi:hypothetical protein